MRINNKVYKIKSHNFPQYDCQELISNLKFLTDIGLVNAGVSICNREDNISHRLTFEGLKVTEKLMDGYYENLM